MQTTTTRLIDHLEGAVDTLINWIPTEDEAVDVAGRVQKLERSLADFRRLVMSELSGTEVGDQYRASGRRSAKRSYNTNGILAAFAQVVNDPLQVLLDADAVRLEWRWTELRDVANRFDVILSIAPHEIEDGDPEALIGEVWGSTVTVTPKETA